MSELVALTRNKAQLGYSFDRLRIVKITSLEFQYSCFVFLGISEFRLPNFDWIILRISFIAVLCLFCFLIPGYTSNKIEEGKYFLTTIHVKLDSFWQNV